ncbi:TIGR00725 family protein [Tolypothrix campylonemoides VB511288]|nr:TIGR00725 family protein [Tolypothrix campylonemoides VB511288]
MRKIIIGVMGPGEKAKAIDVQNAYELGKLIAQEGWVLLTGGRNVGVMEAANQGAKSANGLTIGILPKNSSKGISEAVDIAIFTDMGNARNNINVLSSDVVIACGMGAGTASEIALALKGNKKVILLSDDEESNVFFQKISPKNVYVVYGVEQAIATVQVVLSTSTENDNKN